MEYSQLNAALKGRVERDNSAPAKKGGYQYQAPSTPSADIDAQNTTRKSSTGDRRAAWSPALEKAVKSHTKA